MNDLKIMALLQECFPSIPQFREQDWWNEVPRWRVKIEEGGRIVSYCSGIWRIMKADDREINVLGIGQVATTESHRNRGLVKQSLEIMHALGSNLDFAALTTNSPWIYESSGYRRIDNIEWGMIKSLSRDDWPLGAIDIGGPDW